jgi:hypothetical protein
MILEALEETLASPLSPANPQILGTPKGIIEKSAPVRELEGLPVSEGLLHSAGLAVCVDARTLEIIIFVSYIY